MTLHDKVWYPFLGLCVLLVAIGLANDAYEYWLRYKSRKSGKARVFKYPDDREGK